AATAALFGAIAALTALLVYTTARRWGAGELISALLALWGAVAALPSLNVRPQVLTTLQLAICGLVVTRYRQGEGRDIWILPPLFALWVNLHGGYIFGLALLGL